MLKIRPHHILCMKAYVGKGYSQEFSENMERIIKQLKNDSKVIQIVFGLDDICSKCPYNMENGLCKSEEKVKKIDSKVIEHFNIQEGIYVYKDLKNKVYSNINEEKFTDICKDCEWQSVTNCKELNLAKL